jgi:hypothetical protein
LANWYLASSKKNCPTCRQEWTGIPKINLMLKHTVECLLNQNLKNKSIHKDIPINMLAKKRLNIQKKLNEKNLKIIKKFERLCGHDSRKNYLNFSQNRFDRRTLYFFFNPKFLLGFVSGLYMFAIVFTFFY